MTISRLPVSESLKIRLWIKKETEERVLVLDPVPTRAREHLIKYRHRPYIYPCSQVERGDCRYCEFGYPAEEVDLWRGVLLRSFYAAGDRQVANPWTVIVVPAEPSEGVADYHEEARAALRAREFDPDKTPRVFVAARSCNQFSPSIGESWGIAGRWSGAELRDGEDNPIDLAACPPLSHWFAAQTYEEQSQICDLAGFRVSLVEVFERELRQEVARRLLAPRVAKVEGPGFGLSVPAARDLSRDELAALLAAVVEVWERIVPRGWTVVSCRHDAGRGEISVEVEE